MGKLSCDLVVACCSEGYVTALGGLLRSVGVRSVGVNQIGMKWASMHQAAPFAIGCDFEAAKLPFDLSTPAFHQRKQDARRAAVAARADALAALVSAQ